MWANGKWHLHRLPLKGPEDGLHTHAHKHTGKHKRSQERGCLCVEETFRASLWLWLLVASCGSDCRISSPVGEQRVTNATLMTLMTFLCKCECWPRRGGRTPAARRRYVAICSQADTNVACSRSGGTCGSCGMLLCDFASTACMCCMCCFVASNCATLKFWSSICILNSYKCCAASMLTMPVLTKKGGKKAISTRQAGTLERTFRCMQLCMAQCFQRCVCVWVSSQCQAKGSF